MAGKEKGPSPHERAAYWHEQLEKDPRLAQMDTEPAITVHRLRIGLYCSHRMGGHRVLSWWTADRVGDEVRNARHRRGGSVFVRDEPSATWDERLTWSGTCPDCRRRFTIRWTSVARMLRGRIPPAPPGFGLGTSMRLRIDLCRLA